jgi:hypothetical protein
MSAIFEVVLDVFSGRPNPVWTLGGGLANDLEKRLRHLHEVKRSHEVTPPDLGYRGLRVTRKGAGERNAWEAPYEVYGGVVMHGDLLYADEGRSLERWLLASGGTGVEEDLRKQIVHEMRP